MIVKRGLAAVVISPKSAGAGKSKTERKAVPKRVSYVARSIEFCGSGKENEGKLKELGYREHCFGVKFGLFFPCEIGLVENARLQFPHAYSVRIICFSRITNIPYYPSDHPPKLKLY